jgi:methyl-accepting chemotaxis protein
MSTLSRRGGFGLGARLVTYVAAATLAGFGALALIGLVNLRSLTLDRFDISTAQVTELMADNMAGSVRFARKAGVEAAFAALKQSEPDLAGVVVRDAKGETLVAWRRDGIAEAFTTTALPPGAAVLSADGRTTVEVPIRQSRDAESVGTLRTVWTHNATNAVLWQAGVNQAITSLIALVIAVALLYFALRVAAIRPLVAMTGAMAQLAGGELATAVPFPNRRDEIGEMARTVQVFKDAMIETNRLRADQLEAEQRRRLQSRTETNKLADDFEGAIGEIVETVSSSSTELEASAGRLTATATRAQELATTVAAASEQASTNVQSVAASAEQMTSSVNEISRQVQESSRIANEAVGQARRTNDRVGELAQAASRIGAVVELINNIAGQTNLLALNATIEAARAGEAGRGFAVVASEVKALAEQTAKATGEIGQQITGIQAATQDSVNAIKEISDTIGRMSEISATIASAVEEQGAATEEISRNVQRAASGTTQVSANVTEVQRGASETGSASSQVLSAAQSLSHDSNRLKLEVGKFLSSIRVA